MPTHPSKCRVIQIAVISNITKNSFAVFLYVKFTKPNKLNIIIMQPVLFFAKVYSIDEFIFLDVN
ncbi:protein of unknown function [Methylorubrum extorquens]|uniref:Uncharacterized protein n=1 Tax=Methylorubrum extorquens TaxID=408 RepID=A0A2N9AWQ0_METEX|nr:protein of unknown function [Methylorubrum extorquens]